MYFINHFFFWGGGRICSASEWYMLKLCQIGGAFTSKTTFWYVTQSFLSNMDRMRGKQKTEHRCADVYVAW